MTVTPKAVHLIGEDGRDEVDGGTSRVGDDNVVVMILATPT